MVLAEAYSILIKSSAIEGGYAAFNQTHCSDGELERVGFMSYDSMIHLAKLLMSSGLKLSDDFILFDMVRGPLVKCEWINWLRKEWFSERSANKITMAWLKHEYGGKENPVMAYPDWWVPEKAIMADDFIDKYVNGRYRMIGKKGHVLTLYDTLLDRLLYSAI